MYIIPVFYFAHERTILKDIDIQKIQSCDNYTNLYTEPLATPIFDKLVREIRL